MARRSQCSSAGDDPLDPNYLPPHYREEYRIAIDALIEEDLQGYYKFLQKADVVDFLSTPEIQYIQSSVKVPQEGFQSEQQSLATDGESSSNTYWPIHSDLDVPALDLGWPQMHHFIGPTEVTSLVSPPEPGMPSIKEQARRLIQNAWQVIAVVMDMFTDVDIFADLLNAAARNVAVYILLDEQNAHHFINMVNNCRVNLQSIQFLRVRTVTGVTYHCRSGKSFKGQMMDRFLLTDCRAVLSGNYSFMWSFEKLHRSMAHLFLGQLVATFDEEFRILFAHSQPLVLEDVPAPVDHFSRLQQRKYTKETPLLYRDPRQFQSLDTCHPEDRARHFYDEPMDVDWRLMPLKRQASLHGPSDTYSRFSSQQPYDQKPSRIPTMENTAFKRHSYAEGGGFSHPFLQQQGIPEPKNMGRQFHRGQQPYPEPGTEPELDNRGYDKFQSQDHHSAGQYSEPGLPQGMQPPDNFDPVLNYLSSTRNVELDQGSEKSLPPANLPFKSAQPRRLSLEQPNACQSSHNPTDQKQFFQEPNTDRKDPTVKRGLRNWRITSYLSAYDNPGDEDLAPPQATEPLKEPLNPTQQTAPGMDVSLPKIPNIREFKVPAIPRASQLPSYKKNTVQEEPKTLPDAPTAMAAETTSTPSESSSTAEGEKAEEVEQKQPKTTALGRDGSFRRNYNSAVPRSSRLRSSLIFSSLDQQASQDTQTAPSQQDEESGTNEAEQNKKPFLSQVLGQQRSARKPLGWSHYLKSSTFDSSGAELSKPGDGTSKEDDKDTSKKENSKEEEQSLNSTDREKTESSPSVPQPKSSESKMDQPVQLSKSFLTTPFNVDMNDPDKRFMFFKELAAKRKAAKVAEAEKSKDKAPMKPPTDLKTSTTGKKEQNKPEEDSGKMAGASSSVDSSHKNITADDANKTASTVCESVTLSLKARDKTKKHGSHDVKGDSSLSQSCEEEETSISTNTGKTEVKHKQTATSLHVSTETESPSSKPAEDQQLSKTAVKENSSSHPPTPTKADPATIPSLLQGTDESESPILKPTLEESSSLSPSSVEVAPPSESAALNSDTEDSQSVQLETSVSSPALPSEQQTGSDLTHPDPTVESCSQMSQSLTTSNSAPIPTSGETLSSNVTPKSSSSKPAGDAQLSKTTGKENSSSHPPTATPATIPSPSQGTDESESPILKPTLEASSSLSPSSVEVAPPSESAALKSETEDPQSVQLQTSVSSPVLPSEQQTGSDLTHPNPTVESCSQMSQSPPISISAPIPTSGETLSSNVTPKSSSNKPTGGAQLPKTAGKENSSSHPPTPTKATPATIPSLSQGTDESESPILKPTLEASSSFSPSSVEVAPPSESAALNSDTEDPQSVQLETSVSSPALPPEQQTGSDLILSNSTVESCFSDHTLSDSGSQMSQGPPMSNPASLLSSTETLSPNVTKKDSSSTPFSNSFSSKSDKTEAKESVSSSSCESSQAKEEISTMFTESESLQDPVSQSVSSETPSTVVSAHVESDISPELNTSLLKSTTKTNSEESPTSSETYIPEAEHSDTGIKITAEESEARSSKDNKADSGDPSSSPLSPKSGLPDIFSQDALIQATSPSELKLTDSVTPTPVETECSSPLTDSLGPVLNPEAEKTETNMSRLCSPSVTPSLPSHITSDSNKTSTPTEPTSKTPTELEPTPGSVISESQPSEAPVPAGNGNEGHQSEEPELPASGEKKPEDTEATHEIKKSARQGSAKSKKTNKQSRQNSCSEPGENTSEEGIPLSPKSKQPKSSQSRYHSSTANVLSSSNLRDDTKLLLEQISANSQSRNEATKESPVTDEEKEDEAGKKAEREKERRMKTLSRGPKSQQERDKLLERIQSMRKERKVYSRFEMAP